MQTLPDRANLDHLTKQAKNLLRLYRSGDGQATARFARALSPRTDNGSKSHCSSSACTSPSTSKRDHSLGAIGQSLSAAGWGLLRMGRQRQLQPRTAPCCCLSAE
jgi:hypothetical protein